MSNGNSKMFKFDNTELSVSVNVLANADGSLSINAEDTAIGFGWYKDEKKKGKMYRSIIWKRMNEFSKECGFDHEWSKGQYMPESLFYRLAMKANNEIANKFQNWLANEVIPQMQKSESPENTLLKYALLPKPCTSAYSQSLSNIAIISSHPRPNDIP